MAVLFQTDTSPVARLRNRRRTVVVGISLDLPIERITSADRVVVVGCDDHRERRFADQLYDATNPILDVQRCTHRRDSGRGGKSAQAEAGGVVDRGDDAAILEGDPLRRLAISQCKGALVILV